MASVFTVVCECRHLIVLIVSLIRHLIQVFVFPFIAVCISNYIGQLGFAATAHVVNLSNFDIDRLSILAGVSCRNNDSVVSPYLGARITLAVVITDYESATDLALVPKFNATRGLRYWFGINGAASGRERKPSRQKLKRC